MLWGRILRFRFNVDLLLAGSDRWQKNAEDIILEIINNLKIDFLQAETTYIRLALDPGISWEARNGYIYMYNLYIYIYSLWPL